MAILSLPSRRRAPLMNVRYEDELRLFPSALAKFGVVLIAIAFFAGPYVLSDFWLNVLNYAAVFAVGAIGLNLLTGYTGQVSLGHSVFMGVGAYVAVQFGVKNTWPLLLYLPTAAVVGALVGAVIGPFALRLRGDYLVIVTLGLVFLGEYIFDQWESVTGGNGGTSTAAPLKIWHFDFASLTVFGKLFSRDAGIFWLFWAIVLLTALLAKNLVRTRPGRAMQAVRDRDLAAEVIGVSLFRYKVGAFAISSAFAAVAGAMYGSLQQYVSPSELSGAAGLFVSIQFVAIIILGGLGTIFGGIIGAIVLQAMPKLINRYSDKIPFVTAAGGGNDGIISAASLNNIIYGLLIVAFLVFESRGLAAVWLRVKAYFKTWPFSY
jgi:branched-chain amino acid transport system permease protein